MAVYFLDMLGLPMHLFYTIKWNWSFLQQQYKLRKMAEDNDDDIIMRSMDIRLEMHLFNAAEQTRFATAISLSDIGDWH